MSRLSRWVKTLRATLRMAPCATEAKTAFRSSEKREAEMRASPSEKVNGETGGEGSVGGGGGELNRAKIVRIDR